MKSESETITIFPHGDTPHPILLVLCPIKVNSNTIKLTVHTL